MLLALGAFIHYALKTLTGTEMTRPRSLLYAVLLGALLAGNGGRVGESIVPLAQSASPSRGDDADDGDSALGARMVDEADVFSTPVTMRIDNIPIPVKGSDGRYHLVCELEVANFTADNIPVTKVEVLDTRAGGILATFDAAAIANRLVVRDFAAVPGTMGASQVGILYLHVILDSRRDVPRVIDHRIATVDKGETIVATAARSRIARPTDLLFDAPLRGSRYIAGDGCCDSTRHIRATLPLNGQAFTAQRFAIDWEQLDEQGRIYVGDPKDPESYIIYGKPAYAVADAKVVEVVDGMPNSPIGSLPNLPVDKADGNHVILALGDGSYALYAHFKPYSVRVYEGQYVRRGQVLGLVGTSGNSSEPHLHFHVTDGPTLRSNGVPYLLKRFSATQRGASTAAFDQAIVDGKPIPTVPVSGPARREQVLPLDLWIVDFQE